MKLFTKGQTPSWQNETIEAHRKTHKLELLCWFLQSVYPPLNQAQRRGLTTAQIQEHRYRTVTWPAGWVPLVRADASGAGRVDAELLCELLAPDIPLDRATLEPEFRLYPALGYVSDLFSIPGVQAYWWGDPWDCVCLRCGAVFRDTEWYKDRCDSCRY